MRKKMEWFGMAMVFGFFMFFTTAVSAQSSVVLQETADIKAQMAIDMYEGVHGTTLTYDQYQQSLEPTARNFAKWRSVLATIAKPNAGNKSTVKANLSDHQSTDYFFVEQIVKGIQRNL